ncbi:FHA domain-containing protein [Micromonospora sp. WMMD882]|uniref:FHA domain-containing protein n=1 Tax=Micromonospora sp. WMMD882 TaxID=3015151 RepID=UPI00248B9AF7|nr:FHA domain-containing protein [Micromonospora sp. WMMD882]WBB81011.1 FHA domain-containing protein [Micromonospora sp. WMMD882]
MAPEIVERTGRRPGRRIPVGDTRFTFGRLSDNDVVITSTGVSRFHAEVVREERGYVLYDRGSRNGTLVNGQRVSSHVLQHGDLITITDETFCFEVTADVTTMISDLTMFQPDNRVTQVIDPGPVLRVTVSGGGPVGLSLALLLERLLGDRVAVTVYDGRWTQDGARVAWKNEAQGNVRRQQVVTVQSRQYLNLPEEAQERLFVPGAYSEMWPTGPDSIRGYGPRNIRIAYIEDRLLELANEKSGRIRLVPARFDAAERHQAVAREHVLAICEGARSRTREHFTTKFGVADSSIYSLGDRHLQDVVLGLRVKSDLPDPMSVLLTVAQNRFLLNSLGGEGFLNMRLTDAEAAEVVGLDPVRREFTDCIASRPCLMAREDAGDFQCATHGTLFLPALIKSSPLWRRVNEGLTFFGVTPQNLTAVTAFRLDMVQRPRFTARLYAPTSTTPGTYGFLIGDAANSIHFWPGRGLNSGLASAISLARSLAGGWSGRPFRDADFARHEAAMSMLQYRHKSRAWNAMVTADEQGVNRAIADVIADVIAETGTVPTAAGGSAPTAASDRAPATDGPDREADVEALLERLRGIRARLASRLTGLPDDQTLSDHLRKLKGETVRTLLASGPWDTLTVGGEEVDIDIFYRQELPVAS